MFEGVQNGASPDWMARRLDAVGQRPISALVDITNYVMIDLGRPLHAYDVDKITGNTLTVRMAHEGEEILALNEKTYICDAEMLVIGDADGGDDLAGIMGGERTGVSDTTTRMFLEIAIFDPISVATTGRKLNINSDARYRFERGLDSHLSTDDGWLYCPASNVYLWWDSKSSCDCRYRCSGAYAHWIFTISFSNLNRG
jgi:phenylalanyl-tRNA synthetase beta chain